MKMKCTPRVVALLKMGFTEDEIDAILDVANTKGMDPIEVGRIIVQERIKYGMEKLGMVPEPPDET